MRLYLKLPTTAAAAFFVRPSRGGSGRADLIGGICGRSVSDFCSKNATPKAAKLTLAAQLRSDPNTENEHVVVGAEEDAPPSCSTTSS